MLVATMPIASQLGADFVPRIDEGDIVVAARRMPSISMSEARRLDLATERVLKRFPEVVTVLAMTGRAEVATDPVGMDNTDYLTHLRPRETWTTAHDLDTLGERMKEAIEREVPSTFVSISQPIEDRTNELISGSRCDVAIQLFGEDLTVMSELGGRIGRLMRSIPGAGDVRVERALGLPMLRVRSSAQSTCCLKPRRRRPHAHTQAPAQRYAHKHQVTSRCLETACVHTRGRAHGHA